MKCNYCGRQLESTASQDGSEVWFKNTKMIVRCKECRIAENYTREKE